MKLSVLTMLACLCAILRLNAQDSPNPPANLQTLPAGSYVIAMDNNLQSDNVVGAGKFNLKVYGLIVHLLNYNVKLKWVIRAGKLKDQADFTAMAEQFRPLLIPGSVSRSFKAAPFVIFAEDTTGVSSLINLYNISHSLIGNVRPKVYRTTSSTPNVDIRYNMTGFVPKAAILTDGGNQKIHRDYMLTAGITTDNFSEVTGVSLTGCFTFASEPHNDEHGPVLDATVAAVRNFVTSGRNFLAECAAVRTYENNPFGKFHSTTGFTDANENLGTNVSFPYADLSYYQFEGSFDASNGGSLQNWTITNNISNPAAYATATGTGLNSAIQAASVSKITSGPGGLVFYLGNHEFKANQPDEINGIRLYLNAFITPAKPGITCGSINVLPVKLLNFQGNLATNRVTLQWTVAQNEVVNKFDIERSNDGTNFTTVSFVSGSAKTGNENYQYAETIFSEKIFYRLKMTDKSGVVTYSKILVFKAGAATNNIIKVINNPVTDKLTLSFESTGNNSVSVHILDMNGRQVMQQKINTFKGNNLASLQLPATLTKGMYIANMVDGDIHQTAKFITQ